MASDSTSFSLEVIKKSMSPWLKVTDVRGIHPRFGITFYKEH
jgi:hypothetical protein